MLGFGFGFGLGPCGIGLEGTFMVVSEELGLLLRLLLGGRGGSGKPPGIGKSAHGFFG